MKKEFGILFGVHLLLIIPAYLSPLLVDWWLILIGAMVLQIQYWLIGGCFLTHAELGKRKNHTFYWYYLRKLFPRLDPVRTDFVVRVIVPLALIIIALVLQIGYNFKPLII